MPDSPSGFADLLTSNGGYQTQFSHGGFDGVAHAGIAMVTCMDSRIEPLEMIGLRVGDAKIIRTPGGRVTADALVGCVLGVHLLGVNRILIVPHTRCAMTASTQQELRDAVGESAGVDADWQFFSVVEDQLAALEEDVQRVRTHPLIPKSVLVGGFMYDVDTGLLDEKF